MSSKKRPKNPYTTTSVVFLILTIMFILIIFLPSILNIDMMRWGFGIAFISFFIALSFAITSGVYASMARRLNMVFSEANILAHWEYSQEEWSRYSKEEFKKQKSEKWGIFITIAVITIVVGGIFTLTHKDAWKVLSAVLIGLLVLLAIIAFIIPRIKYSRDRRNINPEVYISLNGIYIAGEFHLWNFLSSKLENITFDENEMLIIVKYSYMTRTGVSYADARIPVSLSKLEEAKIVAEGREKYACPQNKSKIISMTAVADFVHGDIILEKGNDKGNRS
ncbi:MAG: hypothetical protein M1365_10100, partial [Actinobacteria bacterium]|nr:hypothetical protein [Actinomycetota bacterium]